MATGNTTVAATRRRPTRVKLGRPRPVDVHVGSRVRLRRTMLGLSQEKLGVAIGLTFQQVQKYERGTNRIGSSRLFELSKVLDVPVSFFFDDMPRDIETSPGDRTAEAPKSGEAVTETDVLTKRETLELVRAYYRIKDETARKRLYELTRAVARAQDAD